jgi:hypothetical protein
VSACAVSLVRSASCLDFAHDCGAVSDTEFKRVYRSGTGLAIPTCMKFAKRGSLLIGGNSSRYSVHSKLSRAPRAFSSLLITFLLILTGCAVGGGGSNKNPPPPPPPPPPAITVNVSPATVTINLGAIQQFAASVTGATNTAVTWNVNGVPNGNSAVGMITAAGLYTAPQVIPSPAAVTVAAISEASTTSRASAIVTIADGFTLAISGPASLNSGATGNFSATFTIGPNANPSNAIGWGVSGSGCNPCGTFVTSGANATYTAPQSASAISVRITATPVADPAKAASMNVTINPLAEVTVTITPADATLAVSTTETFSAQVTGTTNTGVMWDVNGVTGGNSTVGTVTNSSGSDTTIYTAPAVVPSPASVTIHATTIAMPAVVGSASATITSGVTNPNGPTILQLLPASAFAGSAGDFNVQVNGANFVASGGSTSSTIIAGGTARVTTCASASSCSMTLTAADLAAAGNLAMLVQNPDSTLSNSVNFVVATETTSPGNIPLTPANPAASGEDIYVVEPSTAGSLAPSGNVTLAIQAMGLFVTSTATCTLGASPIVLQRPSTGTATIDICVFSVSGLDPSYDYSITGAATADVSIVAKQPLGLGIVALTLSVPATALAGVRSLFVENISKDKAVASAALEVK